MLVSGSSVRRETSHLSGATVTFSLCCVLSCGAPNALQAVHTSDTELHYRCLPSPGISGTGGMATGRCILGGEFFPAPGAEAMNGMTAGTVGSWTGGRPAGGAADEPGCNVGNTGDPTLGNVTGGTNGVTADGTAGRLIEGTVGNVEGGSVTGSGLPGVRRPVPTGSTS